MNLIEYYKMILKKVSFDAALLKKELSKVLEVTTQSEQEEILKWCQKELGSNYKQIRDETFKQDNSD